MNSTSGSICARESPMHGLAITRGSSLGLASVATTGNGYVLHYRCLSRLLIWCPSSDNHSTRCFPTGISLDHAKSDLHHFYSNVSKYICQPSLWICTILYERRISPSKITFSAAQYAFGCLSLCRFVFEVGNLPPLSPPLHKTSRDFVEDGYLVVAES